MIQSSFSPFFPSPRLHVIIRVGLKRDRRAICSLSPQLIPKANKCKLFHNRFLSGVGFLVQTDVLGAPTQSPEFENSIFVHSLPVSSTHFDISSKLENTNKFLACRCLNDSGFCISLRKKFNSEAAQTIRAPTASLFNVCFFYPSC